MATGVYFGSPKSLLRQPGAYTVVDASGLAFTPPFDFNTICVLGAALGGQPMTPYLFDSPERAQALFGINTPLAEAIRLAFMGGSNGGAATILGVRIDNCGQAYGSLADANSGTELTATFKDFGAYGNTFALSFYPGSTAGTLAVLQGTTIDGQPYIQRWDNQTSFSRLIEQINTNSPIEVAVTAGGTRASQTVTLATSQVDGRATLTDSQAVQRTTQAYCYQYPESMSRNTTDSMLVTYDAAISWAIASINAGTETWSTSAPHPLVAGNFCKLGGATLPPEVDPAKTYLIHTTATNTTFQVAEALAVPTVFNVASFNDGTDTLSAPGNTLSDGDIVQVSGGIPGGSTLGRNYFVVGKSGDDFQLALTANGSAIALSGTISNMQVLKISGGILAISGSVSSATVTLLPGRAAVSASNPTDFNGSRVAAKAVAAYSQSVTNATITTGAYSSDSARWVLSGSETWGHLNGKGLPGSIFEIASGAYAGTYQILHQEWDGLSTDNTRIVRKLTGDRVIPAGVLTATLDFWGFFQFPRVQPALSALETRLPANGLLATGGQYVTLAVADQTIYYPTTAGETIQVLADELAALINDTAEMPVTASAAYNPSTYTATLTLVADKPGTVPNTYPVSILVNAQNTLLVTRGGTLLQGGVDPAPPRNAQGVTSGSLFFANGFDSSPTYQRWLDGLESIKFVPLRRIVAAGTDNIGVQVAIADHCALMSSTPQRRERTCVLSHGNGWTLQQILDRAGLFQSERVVFASIAQKRMLLPDPITGNLRSYPLHYAAAILAGMMAAEGNGVTDPITHSFLKNVQLEGVYQSGSDELDQLIEAGVTAIEADPSLARSSRGYRVVRDVTTYRVVGASAYKSNAYEARTTVDQSDFIAADIRELEEALFIGGNIFPETLEQIKTAINLRLAQRSRERVIYGYDPNFTQVSLNSDSPRAVDAVYKVYPAPDLDFILNTQLLAPIPVEA